MYLDVKRLDGRARPRSTTTGAACDARRAGQTIAAERRSDDARGDDRWSTAVAGQLRCQGHPGRGRQSYEIFRLGAVEGRGARRRDALPYSLKVLLENLLRTEDGANITADDIRALAGWDAERRARHGDPVHAGPRDHAGLHRRAVRRRPRHHARGDGRARRRRRRRSTRSRPAELVIDHSVIADVFGTPEAFERNVEIEYERNRERYQFLRWGQTAFDDFKVVPPGTGIVHQVNIEYLARVVLHAAGRRRAAAYPDTCVGTDSHTTMVNGLGVVGWGVGGIEAEAAMLGQPVSMLIPRVVGFKLTGDAARGRHRHRPGAHDHRDAAQARRGRQVRGVLRRRRLRACRWPTAPRSAT